MNSNTQSSIIQSSSKKSQTIKVCIRLRPLLSHEDVEYWYVDQDSNTISSNNSFQSNPSPSSDINKLLMDSIYTPQSFKFDRIYEKEASSEEIYQQRCSEITKSVLNGYNGSIFTYGQTTSGKTFTMLGNKTFPGILPCALSHLFQLITASKESFPSKDYQVYCTYIEIYNENIHDLLNDAQQLKLVDDAKYGVIVSNAKRIKICSFEEGVLLKDQGEERRKYRDTVINEYSSRSHTIFQLFVESTEDSEGGDGEGDGKTGVIRRFSFMNLVDLAGSEKIHSNETNSGETGYINKSLFVLANVINKLAEGKRSHVPYRDSKLTRMLSQALGGNSLICIICTISPAAVNYFQTLSSLRFGSRAKVIKLKPNSNEYRDERGQIEQYRNEIRKLQEELKNCDEDAYEAGEVYGEEENDGSVYQEEYKMKYYNEVIVNKKLMKENEALRNSVKEREKGRNEVSFLDNFIEEISNVFYQTQLDSEYIKYCHGELNKINTEYKNQLNDLQGFYMKKIQVFHGKIVQALQQQKQEQEQEQKERPQVQYQQQAQSQLQPLQSKEVLSNSIGIMEQIAQGIVFENISLSFDNIKKSNNMESNIQSLKYSYEERVDILEQSYTNAIQTVQKYFNEFQLQAEKSKEENEEEKRLIIINITTELNNQLNHLTQLYHNKQTLMEKNFFATLRLITIKSK